ncbi:MAG: M23 family metallopeptidase [Hyphomonadaceae bacterium]
MKKKRSRARARSRKPAARGRRPILKAVRRALVRAALAASLFAGLVFGAFDGAAMALLGAAGTPEPIEAGLAAASIAAPVWTLDLDGDGAADLANPTLTSLRGMDAYGSGGFGAHRDGGRRLHAGADFIAAPGSIVRAPISGIVTRIGYAYDNDAHLRFIETKDERLGLVARVFYVDPSVAEGDAVKAGAPIGQAQSLAQRYPFGITNHVHVEIDNRAGARLDPSWLLPPAAALPQFAGFPRPQARTRT